MPQPIIQVEGLGKKYLVGHQAAERERYSTLRDVVARNVRGLWRKTRDLARGRQIVTGDTVEEFWALKDVSFDVQPGEVVGIIGRNGAGKSTLLKILSRITEPTEGRVTLRGRVASLLEVGTGFHPELTGRENIYLNGAILGMTRAEIRRKFDEIVAFAEVEKFLDTPVKRYSSGMYVRLAFAVAAHLEPEILIVDEVLAVGDAEFQKKCLGKMGEIGRSGRTVLFVSHNMSVVTRLCSRGVLLESGRFGVDGPPATVVDHYHRHGGAPSSSRTWSDPERAPGNHVARLRAVAVTGPSEGKRSTFRTTDELVVEVLYDKLQRGTAPVVSLHVVASDGTTILVTNDWANAGWHAARPDPGTVSARCTIPAYFLNEGEYSLAVALCSYNPNIVHVFQTEAVRIDVSDGPEDSPTRGQFAGRWPGLIRPLFVWKAHHESPAQADTWPRPA